MRATRPPASRSARHIHPHGTATCHCSTQATHDLELKARWTRRRKHPQRWPAPRHDRRAQNQICDDHAHEAEPKATATAPSASRGGRRQQSPLGLFVCYPSVWVERMRKSGHADTARSVEPRTRISLDAACSGSISAASSGCQRFATFFEPACDFFDFKPRGIRENAHV